MGFTYFKSQSGDTRRDLIGIASFLGHLVGSKRALILTLLAGGFMTGEVTGVSDTIRKELSSVLMTPPDQGGPLRPLHEQLRINYHPDGAGMQ